MRRAAKIDANQPEIVAALEAVGASVVSTAGLGNGFPDIVVGFRGINYLIEIKDGSKPPKSKFDATRETAGDAGTDMEVVKDFFASVEA